MTERFSDVFKPTGRPTDREQHVVTFGNGVQIEKHVWTTADRIGIDAAAIDVIKLHFFPFDEETGFLHMPKTATNHQKNLIRRDALIGFIAMAEALRHKQVTIDDHNPALDFYLIVNTNKGLALFLRQNCGFLGRASTGQVYLKASAFYAEDNLAHMNSQLAAIVERIKNEDKQEDLNG